MMERTYTVKVYNTISNQFEDVAVTKEVYDTYRRTEWNIKDNNESFYEHEIQMSGLIGGEDDGYENFREFVDEENTPERNIVYAEIKKALLESVAELAEEERALVHALYWQGLSEREYSRRSGIPQRTINHRKMYILEKMRKNKIF